MTSFLCGAGEHWLCQQPDAALQMRAPAHLPQHAKAMGIAPKDFEGDLSCAGAGIALEAGGDGVRAIDGRRVEVWDFSRVVIRKLYLTAVVAVHEDVEWRGTDAWSPVYAFKGGVVVAVVQPLMPKAIGGVS